MADKSRLFISWCLLVFMASWGVGCASTPKIDWNSRMGAYSYDQAIIDMGPPDKMAKLSDDSTVAEWMTNRGRYYGSSSSFRYYGSPYGRYGYYPGYLMSPQYLEKSPDTYLRLIFDPVGMLMNWTDFRK